ncbi:hypothetical protein JG687_00010271 [Phytophthora cactorum]|uniref:Uncharacterized protein n=1 Tax=Phytophthora cactorum TaxID=29920 RepID=A0A8T1U7Q4_9STRA|nr:hypothetical protein JG687_00010271 [Phytophthora cactorum]
MIENLKSVGFVQDVAVQIGQHVHLPSLRHHHKRYFNTDVPGDFVVSERDEALPMVAWGRRLGSAVNDMRAAKGYVSQMAKSKEELEKLGFCSTWITERDWTEKVIPSFKMHRQEFGHCIVKSDFKVPSMADQSVGNAHWADWN